MKQLIILLIVVVALSEGRSLQAYKYCKSTGCSDKEEKCAIDRNACMIPFKAYLDCIKSDSVCTALTNSDAFGECWTKCRQDSTSSLYKDLESCYESCGAAEHSTILQFALILIFLSLLL